MENKLVSIVVPVYNSESYIAECLWSIRNQSYKEFEVIMIDDGSTDDSGKICKSFCVEDLRFQYFRQENKGPSSARNYGLTKITGDFLTFVDADDLLEENAILNMVNLSIKWNTDLLVCGIETFGGMATEKIIPTNQILFISKDKYICGIASDDKIYGGGFTVAKFWRVSIIKKNSRLIEFDNELRLYEDKLWIIENAKRIEKILLVSTIVYKYRVLANSLSHKNMNWHNEQRLLASKRIMSACEGYCSIAEFRDVQDMYVMQLMRAMIEDKKYVDSTSKKYVLEAFSSIVSSKVIKWKSKIKYIYACCRLILSK